MLKYLSLALMFTSVLASAAEMKTYDRAYEDYREQQAQSYAEQAGIGRNGIKTTVDAPERPMNWEETPLPAPLEPTVNMLYINKTLEVHKNSAVFRHSKNLERLMHAQYQKELQYYQRREKLSIDICKMGAAILYPIATDDPYWDHLKGDISPFIHNNLYKQRWFTFCEKSKAAHLRHPNRIKYLPVMKSKELEITYGYWNENPPEPRDHILSPVHYYALAKVIQLDYYERFAIHPIYGFEPDDLVTIGGLADAIATLPAHPSALREFTIPNFIGLKNLEILLKGIALNQSIYTLHYDKIYGEKSVALMGEMLGKNKSIQTLHMNLQNLTDLRCINELGAGLESNKRLTTLMLRVYPPNTDPSLMKFPYHKPILDREGDGVVDPVNIFSGLIQGIEKSKLSHVEILWIDHSESAPLMFTQLQEAFMKLPEDRFKKVQTPAYQVPKEGQTHVLFMGDKQ